MSCPQPQIRLTPLTSGPLLRNPKVLLGGEHQPTLLRYLDGWPKRWRRPYTLLIQFAREGESLARFADDSFDLAVVQTPAVGQLPELVSQLTRVARQGLITRRPPRLSLQG
ncbi:class I SAM-dependent methyltransferase [Pseudomonas sp. UL073]|uniref:Class I SAM-dependent methyltransferase n=1 Tax=Zestomonas insulae TaxID=2809017 RepID=A0ABS2I9T2_9GAMM|nr:class I SAM-dependent methyltransferase [Pseudomonas insulae]MBM7059413.1 class I SAM-dependent methyltransferase [Pseudomonas insulae]